MGGAGGSSAGVLKCVEGNGEGGTEESMLSTSWLTVCPNPACRLEVAGSKRETGNACTRSIKAALRNSVYETHLFLAHP